jgi:hypothetical protein
VQQPGYSLTSLEGYLLYSVADPEPNPDPDPLVRGIDPDPDPSIAKQAKIARDSFLLFILEKLCKYRYTFKK